MELLEERIREEGRVLPGNILKVDSFLNHQIDMALMDEIGKEFARLFQDCGVTRVLTIEASGIVPACIAALHMQVPVIFAKKARASNLGPDVYKTMVHSYTYDQDYPIALSRAYLQADDKVLIVDDFLANGQAVNGLLDLCSQAGAAVAGVGICIEKGFQSGGLNLRRNGIRLESLAIVESMDEGTIVFRRVQNPR